MDPELSDNLAPIQSLHNYLVSREPYNEDFNFPIAYGNQASHRSVEQREPSEISGVAQNLQGFLLNMGAAQPAVRTSERRSSQVTQSPPQKRSLSGQFSDRQGKQVRFDIKEGLRSVIDQVVSTGDNSNQQRTLSSDGANENRDPNLQRFQVRKLKAQHRLKFVRPPSQERKNSAPRQAPNQRSNERNSEKQRIRKQNIELAMKYKRNAEEMRRKRFGIEQPQSNVIQDETAYSSAIRQVQIDESRETPNFSLATSKRDLKEELSPETPPRPHELVCPPLLQMPASLDSELSYEEINHDSSRCNPHQPKTERPFGMIVRNNKKIDTNRFSSSRDSSIKGAPPGRPQAGMIVRQRSQSPAHSILISHIGSRGPHEYESNQYIKVGSILRNSSQRIILNQPQPQHIEDQHLKTSPDKPLLAANSSFAYIPIDSDVLQQSETMAQSFQANLEQHSFGTFWNILIDDIPNARNMLGQLKASQLSTVNQLLQTMTAKGIKIYQKLSVLRGSLPKLIFAQLNEKALQYLDLITLRQQRYKELKISGCVLSGKLAALSGRLNSPRCIGTPTGVLTPSPVTLPCVLTPSLVYYIQDKQVFTNKKHYSLQVFQVIPCTQTQYIQLMLLINQQ